MANYSSYRAQKRPLVGGDSRAAWKGRTLPRGSVNAGKVDRRNRKAGGGWKAGSDLGNVAEHWVPGRAWE